MIFNKRDLSQFVKTKLAQEIQKSQIGNFIKNKGAPPIVSTVKNTKPGETTKKSAGIDMGIQIEPGIVPIIYGHVGMSNTQFDLGQKPSDLDAKITTQEVKMIVSEGPIFGLSYRSDSSFAVRDPDNEQWIAGYSKMFSASNPDDTPENLKQVILNDDFVIDPVTSVANYKDVSFELTYGDGTTDKQTGAITDKNTLLFDEDDDAANIEALDDTTNDKLLNDLGDVQAGKGINYVLYWNQETSRWEAKSFNELLNSVGATYDGGAGGSGGDGGSGGQGGIGGTGGVGPADGIGLKYTQWNPPPHRPHIESEAEYTQTITLTNPPDPSDVERAPHGFPLRRKEQTTPFFQTTVSNMHDDVDHIDVTTAFPDGIYLERTLQREYKDGVITICDSTRPFDAPNDHDLECLDPDINISQDGRTVTETDRLAGSVEVYIAFTTTLCNEEFILHEGSYTVSGTRNGLFEHTKSFNIRTDFNAGRDSINEEWDKENAGTRQNGALDGDGVCDTDDVEKFDFSSYDLDDYIRTYPNQIIQAADTVTVYVWMRDKTLDDTPEPTISTNAYIKSIAACDTMNVFETGYSVSTLTGSPYILHRPDHSHRWQGRVGELGSSPYTLGAERCYTSAISGGYSNTKNNDPILVWDYTTQGQPGGSGATGSTGVTGSTGTAGTSGSVTVPNSPDIPTADMARDASYSGDGNPDIVTLPAVTVTNADALASNTLTISVTQGSVDVVTVPGSVTAVGRNTGTLSLTGTAANLQTCLDSGLKFYSTTATRGDVTIRLYISSSEGNSESIRTIRPEAATQYNSGVFSITVNGTSGVLEVQIDNKSIMSALIGSGTTAEIAEDIAEYINASSYKPDLTASASGNVVSVSLPEGVGASYNGKQPVNNAVSPQMDVTITPIGEGVTPSRASQPKQNTNKLKNNNFIKDFTNPLNAGDISFAQIKYRPEQEDGNTEISELGLFVAGRRIQEPTEEPNISFTQWKNAGYTSSPEGYNSSGAWVFFDYLTNTRYGLGNDIILDEDQKEQLYRDIYYAAHWCMLQPTGLENAYNGMFNGVIYGAESKFEALQKIADTFYGKFVYINGNPRLFYDGISFAWSRGSKYTNTPVVKKLINQTNSSDLVYQSGSIDNIYNVINVKYNNPANYFKQEEVQYRNTASIAKYGERETNIDLAGCTSKQQALWHGAWAYETEAVNSETVTYIAGWDHYDVEPGQLVHIVDALRPDNTGIGGRVSAVNGTTLTLDRDCGTGSIAVMDDTGVIQTGTVSGTTATMSGGSYIVDAVFNVYSGTFEANYRVIAVEESEDGIYAITAQKHDPDKYTRIWANTI
jgi:hypothetical protein